MQEDTQNLKKSRRVILTDKAYFTATDTEKERIKTLLRYTIPASRQGAIPEVVVNYTFYPKNVVGIPIERVVDILGTEGYEFDDRRTTTEVEFPEFKFTLRPSQQDIVDNVEGSCIVNAAPSFGKSFTGLAMIGKLGLKALVVVHTTALRDHWVKEVEKVYGFVPSVYGSGRKETDKPITVGNIQSLQKMTKEELDLFGTIVLDECHHSPASTFTNILSKAKAKNKIGLSGTLWRKDGKHVLFTDYFGHKVVSPPDENFLIPTIYRVKTPFRLPDEEQFTNKVTLLLADEDYIKYVTMLAFARVKQGHQVLIIADRVEFLQRIHENLGEMSCILIGDTAKDATEKREEIIRQLLAHEKQVLVGSRQIMSEGISINTLSSLILASPINNKSLLKQVIGRVIRIHEGKLQPEVFDLMLQDGMGRNQARARAEDYIEYGYPTREINFNASLNAVL
jgi:superfamily II DNA or RNA helicase